MAIHVKYMSQLKATIGCSQEQFEIATPCKLEDLLAGLVERHGDNVQGVIRNTDGGFASTLLIFLGDRQVRAGDETLIEDGATVTLLTPISGG